MEKWIGIVTTLLILSSGAICRAGSVADSTYSFQGKTQILSISQRAQEELGYASGLLITDFTWAGIAGPNLELAVRIRLLTNYGPATVYNFATTSAPGTANAANGLERPLIRARQLIYGNYYHGRWFVAEIGLPFFNVSGFTSEFYRYASGRLALHEGLESRFFDPYFELGATVRSLTQFEQPEDIGLIYPPTIDGLAGIQKNLGKAHFAADIRAEQALTETSHAGSFDNSKQPPYGASTRLQLGVEAGYAFSSTGQFFLRGAQRIYRWPDDDSSALWATFDEASLGRSVELMWRGEF